jgi:hypothetical protein
MSFDPLLLLLLLLLSVHPQPPSPRPAAMPTADSILAGGTEGTGAVLTAHGRAAPWHKHNTIFVINPSKVRWGGGVQVVTRREEPHFPQKPASWSSYESVLFGLMLCYSCDCHSCERPDKHQAAAAVTEAGASFMMLFVSLDWHQDWLNGVLCPRCLKCCSVFYVMCRGSLCFCHVLITGAHQPEWPP